jgi:hypothetical protein
LFVIFLLRHHEVLALEGASLEGRRPAILRGSPLTRLALQDDGRII